MSSQRAGWVASLLWIAGCSFDTTGAGTAFDSGSAPDGAVPVFDAATEEPDSAPEPDAPPPPPDAAPPDADVTDVIVFVALTTEIEHGRLGNLTIKLSGPGGTVGVISRPGFLEDFDDGTDSGVPDQYDGSGDQSDMHAGFPITFRDDAADDAEQMGHDLFGVGTAVCEDESVCDYRPNPGAVGGPVSFTAAFVGQLKAGAWRLCVADSHADTNPDGVLEGWKLTLVTAAGSEDHEVTSLGLVIGDDTYDGTIPSMVCHTQIVTASSLAP